MIGQKAVFRAAAVAGDFAADVANFGAAAHQAIVAVYAVLAGKGEHSALCDRREIAQGVEIVGNDAGSNVAVRRRVEADVVIDLRFRRDLRLVHEADLVLFLPLGRLGAHGDLNDLILRDPDLDQKVLVFQRRRRDAPAVVVRENIRVLLEGKTQFAVRIEQPDENKERIGVAHLRRGEGGDGTVLRIQKPPQLYTTAIVLVVREEVGHLRRARKGGIAVQRLIKLALPIGDDARSQTHEVGIIFIGAALCLVKGIRLHELHKVQLVEVGDLKVGLIQGGNALLCRPQRDAEHVDEPVDERLDKAVFV